MGVIGLVAYLLISVSVLLSSRRTIASRDPIATPVGLVGAAAAACFLVVSTLYDVMSFPHGVYIFLYLAGLVAVVAGEPLRDGAETPEEVERAHPAPGRRPSLPPPARAPLPAGVTLAVARNGRSRGR
jgi:peptidoglycan/LPS O-acetylase OafA/YrhL